MRTNMHTTLTKRTVRPKADHSTPRMYDWLTLVPEMSSSSFVRRAHREGGLFVCL